MTWRSALFNAVLATASCLPQPEPLRDAGPCPNLLPSMPEQVCGTPTAPTYSADVANIFTRSCVSCHGSGADASSFGPLTSYAEAAGSRTEILQQVLLCLMPPPGSPPLTDADRETVLTWVSCGSPN